MLIKLPIYPFYGRCYQICDDTMRTGWWLKCIYIRFRREFHGFDMRIRHGEFRVGKDGVTEQSFPREVSGG